MKYLFTPALFLFLLVFTINSCNDFGEKLSFNKGGVVYYKSPVTEEEANTLGKYLEESEFFNDSPQTVQLLKEDKIWLFKVVVKKGVEKDSEYINIVEQFSRELSFNVFNKEPVKIYLCDRYMNTLKEVYAF